jgi:spermidine synthase
VILFVVGIAGAGTMTVELAAVRLLAPWFGASSGVWTNVIGVILLALSVGYLAGARMSRTGDARKKLGRVLLFAALLTVWMPLGARPVAEFFLPSGLALDEAAGLLVMGSLAAALVLFLPAAAMLGCIGPLAVEAVQVARGGHAGDAGGRVLCASTVGSLIGTFGTTHLFLPSFGINGTFLGASIAIALAGAVVLARQGAPKGATLLLLAAVTGGLVFSRYAPPEARPGTEVLAQRQSPYQAIRVVEHEDGTRWLQVNESLDSFQSVWQAEPGLLAHGHYYNLFALPPLWESPADGSWELLVLGLGAGTAVRVLEGELPAGVELASLGVEIDPEVVRLGEEFFDLERGAGREVASGVDARSLLNGLDSERRFDEIVLDAYANNMEIPAHLSSVEFFREVRERLVPGGWFVVNAAGFGLEDPVVDAVARTVAAGFEDKVLAVRVPFSRNCVLLVRRDAELPVPGQPGWRLPGHAADELLGHLALPTAWRWVLPAADDEVLTDDKNPIDALQRESVLGGRGRWLESS